MLKVGDKLFCVFYRGYQKEVEITKIGRKYGMFLKSGREIRFYLDTLKLVEYSGELYTSKEEYESKMDIETEWGKLGRQISYSKPPKGMTLEKIQEIRKIVGLEES